MSTYYINADTGNDSTGDGSSGSPWETFSKAIAQANVSGDGIVLQDSTAHYLFDDRTFNTSITVTGESVGGAILDGGGANNLGWSGADSNVVVVSLLDFTNMNYTQAQKGVYVHKDNATVTFNNCRYYGITITQNQGGIFTNDFRSEPGTVTCNNCLFYDNLGDSSVNSQIFALHRGGNGHTVNANNCSFLFNGGATTEVTRVFSNVSDNIFFNLKNCIFQNEQAGDVSMSVGEEVTLTMNHSCTYGGNGAFTYIPSGTGNITTDPLFVDVTSNDLRLGGASPCIGTGVVE